MEVAVPEIRKVVLVVDETRLVAGRPGDTPLRRVVAMAVVRNPLAGAGYVEDLGVLVGPSAALGTELLALVGRDSGWMSPTQRGLGTSAEKSRWTSSGAGAGPGASVVVGGEALGDLGFLSQLLYALAQPALFVGRGFVAAGLKGPKSVPAPEQYGFSTRTFVLAGSMGGATRSLLQWWPRRGARAAESDSLLMS